MSQWRLMFGKEAGVMQVDVVIFGGGAAGLWLLDELLRRGCRTLLLEAGELGQGQTVASQGIIHGGLKYTLQGWLTPSADEIRDMPLLWRRCLAGQEHPNLQGTPLRSACCYLWRTDSMRSRLGMLGARFGLRVAPQILSAEDRPALLARCAGTVARLDEPVIDPAGFLADLAGRHARHLLKIDAERGSDWTVDSPGRVHAVRLQEPGGRRELVLKPRFVVFAAGAGNAKLREAVGLSGDLMQRRPLHMVMLRGRLPHFAGHCVDGARTRVTITSAADRAGRTVWQIGGQIAETGVAFDEDSLLGHTQSELQAVIPGLDLSGTEGATYRVDRAERATAGGQRPSSAQIVREENCITAWPTKLALAPRLAQDVAEIICRGVESSKTAGASRSHAGSRSEERFDEVQPPTDWPRPHTALPPWETCQTWRLLEDIANCKLQIAN